MGPKNLLFNYWKDLALGSLETYSWKSVHTCFWNEPPQLSERVVFAKFEWKHHKFWNIKTSEGDLQILLLKYRNDLVLGTVETYFLGVGAYVSLKRAVTAVWEGRFCWLWVKISQFFKYKNGGVGPKTFTVYVLKKSCLGLSRNIFCGSRCIRVSETSHHSCLRGSFTECVSSFSSPTLCGCWRLAASD